MATVTTIYRPYRPSNGSEGLWFQGEFCDRCSRWSEETGCDIANRAFWHQIDEPEYPKEWVEVRPDDSNLDHIPEVTCTAYDPKEAD